MAGAGTTAPVHAKPKPRIIRIKVRATHDGYYGDVMRRPGDVFVLEGAEDPTHPGRPRIFSDKWMELAAPEARETVTTNNDVLRQQHDEILRGKTQQGQTVPDDTTTSRDVLGVKD